MDLRCDKIILILNQSDDFQCDCHCKSHAHFCHWPDGLWRDLSCLFGRLLFGNPSHDKQEHLYCRCPRAPSVCMEAFMSQQQPPSQMKADKEVQTQQKVSAWFHLVAKSGFQIYGSISKCIFRNKSNSMWMIFRLCSLFLLTNVSFSLMSQKITMRMSKGKLQYLEWEIRLSRFKIATVQCADPLAGPTWTMGQGGVGLTTKWFIVGLGWGFDQSRPN